MKEKSIKDTIKAINDAGEEVEYKVLLMFDIEEFGKSYVFYTDGTTNDNGELNVYISAYNIVGDTVTLSSVESDEEWNYINQKIEELQSSPEDNNEKEKYMIYNTDFHNEYKWFNKFNIKLECSEQMSIKAKNIIENNISSLIEVILDLCMDEIISYFKAFYTSQEFYSNEWDIALECDIYPYLTKNFKDKIKSFENNKKMDLFVSEINTIFNNWDNYSLDDKMNQIQTVLDIQKLLLESVDISAYDYNMDRLEFYADFSKSTIIECESLYSFDFENNKFDNICLYH